MWYFLCHNSNNISTSVRTLEEVMQCLVLHYFCTHTFLLLCRWTTINSDIEFSSTLFHRCKTKEQEAEQQHYFYSESTDLCYSFCFVVKICCFTCHVYWLVLLWLPLHLKVKKKKGVGLVFILYTFQTEINFKWSQFGMWAMMLLALFAFILYPYFTFPRQTNWSDMQIKK